MQKRKRNMIFGVIAAAVALVSFIGCDVSSGSGTMEVSITDAPLMADNVDHGCVFRVRDHGSIHHGRSVDGR